MGFSFNLGDGVKIVKKSSVDWLSDMDKAIGKRGKIIEIRQKNTKGKQGFRINFDDKINNRINDNRDRKWFWTYYEDSLIPCVDNCKKCTYKLRCITNDRK